MLEKMICYLQHISAEERLKLQMVSNERTLYSLEFVESIEQLCCAARGRSGILVVVDDTSHLPILTELELYVVLYQREDVTLSDASQVRYIVQSIEEIPESYWSEIYCAYAGIPKVILATNTCILREVTEEDVPRLYELYDDPEVLCNMEGLADTMEEELDYTRAYIDSVYGFYGYGTWVITEKHSGRLIGRAGLEANETVEELELGFLVERMMRRQGIAYEICSAIIQYATCNELCDQIVCKIRIGNIASQSLCEKLGFVRDEGIEDQRLECTYRYYVTQECRRSED